MRQPNILFIMCDQMRFDALGCAGNSVVRTPNYDRLAQSGVYFTNAFTPDPICVPARACITTGHYPHKCTGIKNNSGAIREGYPLLGEELEKRGYETYAMGKLHYLPYMGPESPRTTYGIRHVELTESGRLYAKYAAQPHMRGLEDYIDYLETVGYGGFTRGNGLGNNDIFPAPSAVPKEYFVDAWVADRVIYHLKRHLSEKKDRPFFMWASFPKPHSAYEPPRPYDSLYDPRRIPNPAGSIDDIKERGISDLFLTYLRHDWDRLSPEAKRVIRAFYYGLVTFQDEQAGRLLDFLDINGLRENTIVVYTADHGDMLGDFGLYFKQNFYNGSVRIPMMIRYPGRIPGGVVCGELVGLQDLLPTLLSLSGAPLDRPADGTDLTGAMTGCEPVRDFYISQCGDDPKQRYMVANKRYKYIYHQQGGVEELYDQQEDRAELHNLAQLGDATVKNIKKDMREQLIFWCNENGDDAMLHNGDLAVSEAADISTVPMRPEGFGRRWY